MLLKDIAKKQDLSEKYLSKLVIPLKTAKLINSTRGAHGGYIVTRPPENITVREVVEALEGDLCPVECVKDSNVCKRSETCPTRDVWSLLEKEISKALENVSLQSIIEAHNEKRRSDALLYII